MQDDYHAAEDFCRSLDQEMRQAVEVFAFQAGLPHDADGDLSRAATVPMSIASAFHLLCTVAHVPVPNWLSWGVAMESAAKAVEA